MNDLNALQEADGVSSRQLKPVVKAVKLIFPRIFLLFFLLGAFNAAAVPAGVEAVFKEKYPAAEKVKWGVDRNGLWEAKFDLDGIEYRADFKKDGSWVETENNIKFRELPDAVQQKFRSEFGDAKISEVERVDSAEKGLFFDVEIARSGKNLDIEYAEDGTKLGAGFLSTIVHPFQTQIGDIGAHKQQAEEMSWAELLTEFGLNLFVISIFAWAIYYRRHHDHQMLFLLLGFNLFLFPIFLLSTSLSAGFGFTIFALLALVRLRSETFSKSEMTYMVGAVALTFINALLPAKVELVAASIVLATAWIVDHPRMWTNQFHSTEIRFRVKDKFKVLDHAYLKKYLETRFLIEINYVRIISARDNDVKVSLSYRDRNGNGSKIFSKSDKAEAKVFEPDLIASSTLSKQPFNQRSPEV